MSASLGVARWALCFIVCTNFYQAILSAASSCDDGWVMYRGHCYGFYTGLGLPDSLNNAVRFCRALGADVVTVESEEENTFISTQLEASKHKSRCFLGITDYWKEGEFQTLRRELVTYNKFTGPDPDNGGATGVVENCAFLYSFTGNWKDQRCNGNTKVDSYVCEKALYERSTQGLSVLQGKRLDQANCQLEAHTITTPIECAARYLQSSVALSFNVARDLLDVTPNCYVMSCAPMDVGGSLITDSKWTLHYFPEIN